jgi:hypothetical protein
MAGGLVGPHQSGTWDSRTVFCLIEHPRMLSRKCRDGESDGVSADLSDSADPRSA